MNVINLSTVDDERVWKRLHLLHANIKFQLNFATLAAILDLWLDFLFLL